MLPPLQSRFGRRRAPPLNPPTPQLFSRLLRSRKACHVPSLPPALGRRCCSSRAPSTRTRSARGARTSSCSATATSPTRTGRAASARRSRPTRACTPTRSWTRSPPPPPPPPPPPSPPPSPPSTALASIRAPHRRPSPLWPSGCEPRAVVRHRARVHPLRARQEDAVRLAKGRSASPPPSPPPHAHTPPSPRLPTPLLPNATAALAAATWLTASNATPHLPHRLQMPPPPARRRLPRPPPPAPPAVPTPPVSTPRLTSPPTQRLNPLGRRAWPAGPVLLLHRHRERLWSRSGRGALQGVPLAAASRLHPLPPSTSPPTRSPVSFLPPPPHTPAASPPCRPPPPSNRPSLLPRRASTPASTSPASTAR